MGTFLPLGTQALHQLHRGRHPPIRIGAGGHAWSQDKDHVRRGQDLRQEALDLLWRHAYGTGYVCRARLAGHQISQAAQENRLGAGRVPQPLRGILHLAHPARVGEKLLSAVPGHREDHLLLGPGGLGGEVAPHQDSQRSAPEAMQGALFGHQGEEARQPLGTEGVLGAATVVHMARAEHAAHQLAKEVSFLVRHPLRADASDRFRPGLRAGFGEPGSHVIERLVPGSLNQCPLAPDQRPCESIRAVHHAIAEAPAHAEEVVVHTATGHAAHADDMRFVGAPAFRLGAQTATVAAVLAEGVRHAPVARPGFGIVELGRERAHGTHLDAVAAQLAIHRAIDKSGRLGSHAAVGEAERADAHDLIAVADAARAMDAAAHHLLDDGREHLFRAEDLRALKPAHGHPVIVDVVLEVALGPFVAMRAVDGVVGEEELQDAGARLRYLLRVGGNHHAVRGGERTRGDELGALLDADQAHAACADRL